MAEGHPDTVAFVLSYLLDGAPARLIDFVDRNGTVKPKNAVRFGGSKPLLAVLLLQKR
jgi:hypothetical protein